MGFGVTAVPEWAEGGGLAGFYGGNLKHNIGLMPGKDACLIFPKKSVVISSASCELNSTKFATTAETCSALYGDFTAEVTELVEEKNCVGNNGFCCIKYDDSKKMWRDTVVIILKTPYCIGTLIALILNAVLPSEAMDDYERSKSNHGSIGKM